MTNKSKFAPVKVKNPTSLQHVVWLKPSQSLVISLDNNKYPDVRLDVLSDHLYVSAEADAGSRTEFLLVQEPYLVEWSEYSSCHLGDIWVESAEAVSRLSIMLFCTNKNKENFITAINPNYTDIRIKPQNILEVVIYDKYDNVKYEWNWEPKENPQVGVDLLSYSYCDLNEYIQEFDFVKESDPNSPYAILPRFGLDKDNFSREHHFWFRFKGTVLQELSKIDGLKNVGSLQFTNANYKSSIEPQYKLSLILDLDNKQFDKVLKTLMIKTDTYVFEKSYPKLEKRFFTPFYQKPSKIRNIEFKLIKSNMFDDGCESIKSMPAKEDLSTSNINLCGFV